MYNLAVLIFPQTCGGEIKSSFIFLVFIKFFSNSTYFLYQVQKNRQKGRCRNGHKKSAFEYLTALNYKMIWSDCDVVQIFSFLFATKVGKIRVMVFNLAILGISKTTPRASSVVSKLTLFFSGFRFCKNIFKNLVQKTSEIVIRLIKKGVIQLGSEKHNSHKEKNLRPKF